MPLQKFQSVLDVAGVAGETHKTILDYLSQGDWQQILYERAYISPTGVPSVVTLISLRASKMDASSTLLRMSIGLFHLFRGQPLAGDLHEARCRD
jgi:hypothetical protein